MRKFIICLFALFAVGNATAETMCVKLPPADDCEYELPGENQADWAVRCNGVPISGIAYCSNQVPNGWLGKSDSITIGRRSEENYFCWCKVVSPAVSSWVFCNSFLSHATEDGESKADACAAGCADYCATTMAEISDFKTVIFSDLGM